MQGRWKVETEVIEGEKTPAAQLEKATIIIKGDTLSWEPKDDNAPVRFKLDLATKPAAIDLIDGKSMAVGIYQLDGDTLKICWEDFNSGSAQARGAGGDQGKPISGAEAREEALATAGPCLWPSRG